MFVCTYLNFKMLLKVWKHNLKISPSSTHLECSVECQPPLSQSELQEELWWLRAVHFHAKIIHIQVNSDGNPKNMPEISKKSVGSVGKIVFLSRASLHSSLIILEFSKCSDGTNLQKKVPKISTKCGECCYHSFLWSLDNHLPTADARKSWGLVCTCIWKMADLSKWFR